MEQSELTKLREKWQQFVKERDWAKFHSPKNLVMGISIEASELMEIFQWLTLEESLKVMQDPTKATKVREEVADVFLLLLYLADTLGINLVEAGNEKIDLNAKRYPAHLCKGTSLKHTELPSQRAPHD